MLLFDYQKICLARRKQLDKTQDEMAAKVGIARQNWNYLESNRLPDISLTRMTMMVEALGGHIEIVWDEGPAPEEALTPTVADLVDTMNFSSPEDRAAALVLAERAYRLGKASND